MYVVSWIMTPSKTSLHPNPRDLCIRTYSERGFCRSPDEIVLHDPRGSPMTSVLIKAGKDRHKRRKAERKQRLALCSHRPRMPGAPKMRRGWNNFSLGWALPTPWFGLWPPEHWESKFLCFKSSRLWSFVMAALGSWHSVFHFPVMQAWN